MKKKNLEHDGYDQYMYTGLQGFVMSQNHKIISKNIPEKLNKTILEIGGAAKPHCSMVELKGVDDYWISDSAKVFERNNHLIECKIKKHLYEDDRDYSFFKKSDIFFTRIIASHVWEHIDDPEGNLLKWVSLLSEDGVLDIAIPCDPGWAWRLGQLVGRKKVTKLYNMSSKDRDLFMAREHVNPCQNLIRIVKAYTGKSGKYFPFNISLVDINLFIFFRLKKSDFVSQDLI